MTHYIADASKTDSPIRITVSDFQMPMSLQDRDAIVRELKRDGVDLVWWMFHFGYTRLKDAKCADCQDFLAGLCEGRKDPRDCFHAEADE